MADPHADVAYRAMQTNEDIRRLIAKLGTTDNPRGEIMTAYRQARRDAPAAIESPALLNAVFDNLADSVSSTSNDVLAQALDIGLLQATGDLSAYGLDVANLSADDLDIEAMIAGIIAVVELQRQQTLTAYTTGQLNEDYLVGDGTRVGLLSPAPVVKEGSRWSAAAVAFAFSSMIQAALGRSSTPLYQKQAFAAIDRRTTNCCLLVNGQVQRIDADFILTGTPRYADRQPWPGFHDYCRTATGLIHSDDIGDDLTREIEDASQAELDFRADINGQIDDVKKRLATATEKEAAELNAELARLTDKLNEDISPAFSFSRR